MTNIEQQSNPGINKLGRVEGITSKHGKLNPTYLHIAGNGAFHSVSLKFGDSPEPPKGVPNITLSLEGVQDLTAQLIAIAAYAEEGAETAGIIDLHIDFTKDVEMTRQTLKDTK